MKTGGPKRRYPQRRKTFEVIKADVKLAETLNIRPDDKVWHVKRVRFIKQNR